MSPTWLANIHGPLRKRAITKERIPKMTYNDETKLHERVVLTETRHAAAQETVICGGYTEEELDFFQRWQPTATVTGKDEEESERVGIQICAWPRQCWFNARRVIQKLKEYAEASYVEGWAVCHDGLHIEHGWVVRDGLVIDPTLPRKVAVYFPGLEFRGRAGIKEFLDTPGGRKCKKSPFLYAFGWGGCMSPSFRRCVEAATAYVLRHFSSAACEAHPKDDGDTGKRQQESEKEFGR